MKIYQIATHVSDGDGMGNHIIQLHKVLSNNGYEVETYSETGQTNKIPLKVYEGPFETQMDDIVFLHFGIHFYPQIEKFKCRKILVYHNITTPELFENYDNAMKIQLERSYYDLIRWLKNETFEHIFAMSEYNKKDLIQIGYDAKRIEVTPYLIPFDSYDSKQDEDLYNKLTDGKTNVLFVGRVVPNKKHEDIIRAFAQYQQDYDADARLFLIGGGTNCKYGKTIEKYIELLNIKNVTFGKRVSDAELVSIYKAASVFLCMSEHEGFCIPLIEAMRYGIPVIAYNATAVPDTMGGAGICLDSKDPRIISKWIDLIVKDKSFRKKIIEEEKNIAEKYSLRESQKLNMDVIHKIICK